MEWYSFIFELIDMRSFSNLWYWIALAVFWSSASHWVLGIPYDMVQRARRVGGQTALDLEIITRVNVNRLLYIWRVSGMWLIGFACFLLSTLAVLGFWYWMEFAQAVLLLMFPMVVIGAMSLATARRIEQQAASGETLRKILARHRFAVQAIGMVAIFFTALWGMYQNLTIGVLGH